MTQIRKCVAVTRLRPTTKLSRFSVKNDGVRNARNLVVACGEVPEQDVGPPERREEISESQPT